MITADDKLRILYLKRSGHRDREVGRLRGFDRRTVRKYFLDFIEKMVAMEQPDVDIRGI